MDEIKEGEIKEGEIKESGRGGRGRGQGRRPGKLGQKVRESPYEELILQMLAEGKSPDAIVKYLSDKYYYLISVPTLKSYLNNFVMTDDILKEKMDKYLQERNKALEKCREEMPNIFIDIIKQKEELLQRFQNRISLIKEREKNPANENLILRYNMAIHEIENWIINFTMEHNWTSIFSSLIKEFIHLAFLVLVPHLRENERDRAIEDYKKAVQDAAKEIEEKIIKRIQQG